MHNSRFNQKHLIITITIKKSSIYNPIQMSQILNFSINQSHQKSHHKNLSQGASKPSSKLPLISKTPGPGSPQNYSKALQSEKNDFELELNTKHRILKSMLDIKTPHPSDSVSKECQQE